MVRASGFLGRVVSQIPHYGPNESEQSRSSTEPVLLLGSYNGSLVHFDVKQSVLRSKNNDKELIYLPVTFDDISGTTETRREMKKMECFGMPSKYSRVPQFIDCFLGCDGSQFTYSVS